MFLVTWHGDDDVGGLIDGEFEIFGQFLTRQGAQVGSNDFRISDLGGTGDADFDAQNAAVASSSGEILVVWHGDDNVGGLVDNELEIFGQKIDTSFFVFADGFETGDSSIWSNTVP